MQRIKPILATILLVMSVSLCGGCLAVAAAAGAGAATAYAWSDTEGLVSANPPEVIETAEAMIKEEPGLFVTSTTSGKQKGELLGRTTDDQKIKIYVEKRSEGISKVWLRVGLGDESRSDEIYARLTDRLGRPDGTDQ